MTFPVDSASISGLSAQTYTGKAIKPKPTVKLGNTVLVEGADYTLSYGDNVEPGTATVIVTGTGVLSGSVSGAFKIEKSSSGSSSSSSSTSSTSSSSSSASTTLAPKPISAATVKLAKTKYAYTGAAVKPKVKVSHKGKALKKGVDYTVSYPKSPKKVGAYKLTVKGKGKWKGSVKKSYKIVPKASKITFLKAVSPAGAAHAKWKKVKGVTGYQMWISTSKKFDKGTIKTDFAAKGPFGKKCAYKGGGLPKGKELYVKIRAYQKVKGKTYYSAWSKVKAVKTKG